MWFLFERALIILSNNRLFSCILSYAIFEYLLYSDVLLNYKWLFIINLCMKFSRYIRVSKRSANLHFSLYASGDEGIRTPDPLLARQVLSQLSYTPI